MATLAKNNYHSGASVLAALPQDTYPFSTTYRRGGQFNYTNYTKASSSLGNLVLNRTDVERCENFAKLNGITFEYTFTKSKTWVRIAHPYLSTSQKRAFVDYMKANS